MYKVLYLVAKRFCPDPLETSFTSNNLFELEKINYHSMTLVMPTPFKTKKYLRQKQQVRP